jgi:hypothetical protein
MQNPNCDGGGPCLPGEVRKLPLGSNPHHGNTILCPACFSREKDWRKARNRELSPDVHYKLPLWEELEVYSSEVLPMY